MSSNTRETLIRTAEYLLRSKGYTAFSYADLAQSVGIRKASIHHHFPTKEDLGIAVVEAYIGRVKQTLADIEAESATTTDCLRRFTVLFTCDLEEGMLPLCGALAAEMVSLPGSLQLLARHFLALQLRWLVKILNDGLVRGELPESTNPEVCAHDILCQMEGVSFVNWTLDKSRKFDFDVLLRIAGINR